MSVSKLYDAVAAEYDSVVESSQYVGPRWLELALADISEPRSIVDFGCANGALGKILRRRYPFARLVGFDASPGMIREAKLSAAYDELALHDLNSALPSVGTASIQLAVALGFAEFLDDPRSFLSETARLLAPGGTLLISFQEFWPDRPRLAPRTTRTGVVLHHAYSLAEVSALLHEQPFIVNRFESVTGYVSAGFAYPYILASAVRRSA